MTTTEDMAGTAERPMLRIHSIRAQPLDVDLLEPFSIAVGTMHRLQNVLVKVVLDDGTEGLGEAAPFAQLTGETQATVFAAVAGMAALLEGAEATSWRAAHERLVASFRTQTSARSAVICALLDALARRARVPLRNLFGGRERALTTDLTLPLVGPVRAAARAAEIRTMGIRVIKTKVGHDPATDLDRVVAIKSAYPEVGLILDANQGFTPKEAVAFVDSVLARGIRPLLLEQPVHRDDIAGMALVRARCPVPVFADESVFTAADAARVLSAGAADGVNIKLAKCGGFVEAMDIAAICRALGAGLMIGAMVETRLGLSASAHFAAGTGRFRFVDLDTHMLLAGDPFVGGFEQEGDVLTLVEEPGLGVRVRGE